MPNRIDAKEAEVKALLDQVVTLRRRAASFESEADELAARIAAAGALANPDDLTSWDGRRRSLVTLAGKARAEGDALAHKLRMAEERQRNMMDQARGLRGEIKQLEHRTGNGDGYYPAWIRKAEAELRTAQRGQARELAELAALRDELAALAGE